MGRGRPRSVTLLGSGSSVAAAEALSVGGELIGRTGRPDRSPFDLLPSLPDAMNCWKAEGSFCLSIPCSERIVVMHIVLTTR